MAAASEAESQLSTDSSASTTPVINQFLLFRRRHLHMLNKDSSLMTRKRNVRYSLALSIKQILIPYLHTQQTSPTLIASWREESKASGEKSPNLVSETS